MIDINPFHKRVECNAGLCSIKVGQVGLVELVLAVLAMVAYSWV